MEVESRRENKARQLSDVQLAEIKKAFQMVDQDGNGQIDASEVRSPTNESLFISKQADLVHDSRDLLRAILNAEPSESELQQILNLVDTNRDGVIEFDEFVAAMSEWMAEDYSQHGKGGAASRKRSVPSEGGVDAERKEVHKRIKSFFAQFQKTDSLEKIRSRLATDSNRSYMALDDPDRMDLVPTLLERQHSSSQQKLEALMVAKNAIAEFPGIAAALHSENPYQALEATRTLARVLSIVEVFDTPYERRPIAEVLVRLYELMVQYSVAGRVVRFLGAAAAPDLQYEAARVVRLFAPGPRIAATPEDSLLHPNQMFFKKLLVSEGLVPALIGLLASPTVEVREEALLALAALAAYNPECRDFVLAHHGLAAVTQLTPVAPVTLLRKASWALCVLCGVTHPPARLPRWEAITPCFPFLSMLLFSNDEEVLVNVCEALALVLPGVPEPNLDKRLCELLALPSATIHRAAFQPLLNILRLDEPQSQLLMRCGLPTGLAHALRSSDVNVRLQACEALVLITGLRGQIGPLIEAEIPPKLLELVQKDDQCRWKAVKVVKYITRGSPSQVRYLVNLDAIRILVNALGSFKEYDRVLTSVYKFHGASFNFEFVRDVVTALQNIINVGELELDEGQTANRYALRFDLEAVDRLSNVIATLTSSSNEAAWRTPAREGEPTIEDRIKWLLYKLKLAHDANAERDPVSRHVSNMIASTWRGFFDTASNSAAAGSGSSLDVMQQKQQDTLLLKLYYGDEKEVRVLEVPGNVTYEDLKTQLQSKFQRILNITYRDDDGDNIAIDDQESLAKAIGFFRKRSGRTIRLHLSEPTSSSAATSTPLAISSLENPSTSPSVSPASSPLLAPALDSRAPPVPAPSALPPATLPPPVTPSSSPPPQASLFSLAAPAIKDAMQFSLTANLEDFRRLEKQSLFETLEKTTHFGKAELEQLYEHWAKHAAANGGRLGKEHFADGLRQLGITDPLIVEQNFTAFDDDKDGCIDFREFVCGLSTILRGTTEERLRFMFKAYDADGNGYLEPHEVLNVFRASLISKGVKFTEQELQNTVAKIFQEIDVNKDGKLSFEEFKLGVEQQKLLIA